MFYPNNVHNWRTLYLKSGIEGVTQHQKNVFKPWVFSASEHEILERKFNNSENELHYYLELKAWVEHPVGRTFNYNTLLYYCIRNFKLSGKGARKSHIKKDDDTGIYYKKTSVKSDKR